MGRHRTFVWAYRAKIILLLLIMLIFISPAADTMFRADPQHTGIYDNSGIVPVKNEVWHFNTGGFVDSSPAAVNGVVYE